MTRARSGGRRVVKLPHFKCGKAMVNAIARIINGKSPEWIALFMVNLTKRINLKQRPTVGRGRGK